MQKLCLVAVDIRSTHNVGAFFRTCDGLNAELVLVGITARPQSANDDRLPYIAEKAYAAIAKTALGAERTVAWRYFSSWNEAFDVLKAEGYAVYSIEQTDKSIPLPDMKIVKATALIVGPEVGGLTTDITDACDAVFEIPMLGQKESLNVSVAASIALYQARLNDL